MTILKKMARVDSHKPRKTSFGAKRYPVSLAAYDRTKDIKYNPYFRGAISRFVWRFYMYRVTAAACWFLGLSCVFLLYGTTSLDSPVFVPLMYSAGIWLVAWSVAMFLPPRAKVYYTLPSRVATGSPANVQIEITSNSKLPIFELRIVPMRLPPFIDFTAASEVDIQILKPVEQVRRVVTMVCHRRGIYELKGFRAETSFPLGLLRGYSNSWQTEQVLVYPTFKPLSSINLPAGKTYQPGGVALASKLGDSMEFIGNREYRDGDNVRDIDWKATARLMVPIIREYREEYFYRVGVIQDTFLAKGGPEREDDFERAISICASVSDYMAREEYVVDLFAAGPNLYHLTAGRSLAFQDQILDILACLEPADSEPFMIIEPELLESLAQLTTVICVLLDWDNTRREFVDRIRLVSEVKVIIVRQGACTIDPSNEASGLSLSYVNKDRFESGVGVL